MKMGIHKSVLSIALASALTFVGVSGQVSADTLVRANVNYSSFDSNWLGDLQNQAEAVVSNEATPLITWVPSKRATPDANILEEIVNGKHDAYVNDWLNDLKSWLSSYPQQYRPNIALQFAPDLNDEKHFKSAWRYLHKKFAAAGVNDSVGWVWNPNMGKYPGDDVVDWLSIESDRNSSEQAFSRVYTQIVSRFPNKSIMLVNTPKTNNAPEKNELYISHLVGQIKDKYPAIKSIALFNTHKVLGSAFNVIHSTGHAMTDNATRNQNVESALELSVPAVAKDTKQSMQVESLNANRIDQTIKPVVVGREVLAREAQGIRKMSKAALRKWRLEGILSKISP